MEENKNNIEIIKDLDVSESWKDKFRIIARGEPEGFGFQMSGFTKYKNISEIKQLPLMKRTWGILNNVWAFLFSVIYYALKGMWKKAISLFVLHIIIVVISSLIDPALASITSWIVPILASGMANYDFYRFKVLNERNFWW